VILDPSDSLASGQEVHIASRAEEARPRAVQNNAGAK
jgi:hypothetical protein